MGGCDRQQDDAAVEAVRVDEWPELLGRRIPCTWANSPVGFWTVAAKGSVTTTICPVGGVDRTALARAKSAARVLGPGFKREGSTTMASTGALLSKL